MRYVKRLVFCGSLAGIYIVAQAASADTAVDTVHDFYVRYLAYNAKHSSSAQAPTLHLSAAFAHDVEVTAKVCDKYVDGPCGWGADGDAYLDTQESQPDLNAVNSGLIVQEISKSVVQVRLNVYPSEKDAKGYYEKVITYKMKREGGRWVVDDVTYPNIPSTRLDLAKQRADAIAHPDHMPKRTR
jgi:hypothetical protein